MTVVVEPPGRVAVELVIMVVDEVEVGGGVVVLVCCVVLVGVVLVEDVELGVVEVDSVEEDELGGKVAEVGGVVVGGSVELGTEVGLVLALDVGDVGAAEEVGVAADVGASVDDVGVLEFILVELDIVNCLNTRFKGCL